MYHYYLWYCINDSACIVRDKTLKNNMRSKLRIREVICSDEFLSPMTFAQNSPNIKIEWYLFPLLANIPWIWVFNLRINIYNVIYIWIIMRCPGKRYFHRAINPIALMNTTATRLRLEWFKPKFCGHTQAELNRVSPMKKIFLQ